MVLEEGGEEEGSARTRVDRRSHNAGATVPSILDPQGRRFSRRRTDFALQAIVKCRAVIAKRVAVLLHWHSDSGEVRVGRAMSL